MSEARDQRQQSFIGRHPVLLTVVFALLLLGGTLAGYLVGLGPRGEVAMEPPKQGDPVQLARDFFRSRDVGDNADDSWLGLLSEDCRYEMGLLRLDGRQEIESYVRELIAMSGYVRVVIELKHVAAMGNVVLFERVDHHLGADGSDLVVPIAGSLPST